MKRKVFVAVAVLMALAVLLSACKMSAPAPAGVKTSAGTEEIPLPESTKASNELVNDVLNATRTAIAAGGGQNAQQQQTPVAQATTQPEGDTNQGGGVGTPQVPEPQAGQGEPNPTTQQGGGAPASTPKPQTEPNPVVTTPETPATYTLRKGEHPYCIARRFNVNAGSLLSANGLGTSGVFQPGLTLKIPTGTSWNQGSRTLIPHPANYSVLSGDTLYSIACKFGDVHPESIAQANGIDVNASLSAGQVLAIP